MRAAVFAPPSRRLVVEDVTLAPLGPYDVRVRVDASGVCGSDIGRIALSLKLAEVETVPAMVLGHEAAGTVLEVGERVSRVAARDRVIASFTSTCGRCWFCARGESYLCERYELTRKNRRVRRSDGTEILQQAGLGTFADEMVVHQDTLVTVRTDLPAEQLALIGCSVATGVGAALFTAEVKPGSSVAVIGCGGVGQFVIQGARVGGAARIFAIDTVDLKLDSARANGATDVVNGLQSDAVDEIREATGGRGVDYAFEVAGGAHTTQQAYDMTRRGGTVVAVGRPAPGTKLVLDAECLYRGAKRLIGSFYGSAVIQRDFPRLVELAECGRLDIAGAISKRFTLGEINDALDALESGHVVRAVLC